MKASQRARKALAMELRVCNCPSQDLGFTNCVFVNPAAYGMLGGEPNAALHVEINGFVYQAKPHDGIEDGESSYIQKP